MIRSMHMSRANGSATAQKFLADYRDSFKCSTTNVASSKMRRCDRWWYQYSTLPIIDATLPYNNDLTLLLPFTQCSLTPPQRSYRRVAPITGICCWPSYNWYEYFMNTSCIETPYLLPGFTQLYNMVMWLHTTKISPRQLLEYQIVDRVSHEGVLLAMWGEICSRFMANRAY